MSGTEFDQRTEDAFQEWLKGEGRARRYLAGAQTLRETFEAGARWGRKQAQADAKAEDPPVTTRPG